MPKATETRSYIGPRQVRQVVISPEEIRQHGVSGLGLDNIGVGINNATMGRVVAAMDEAVTAPTSATLLQFAQAWLPGTIRILTTARKVDTLIGIRTAGSWEMESIVQKVMEHLGSAQPYTDYGNINLSSYNPSFETRDIVRFEQGMQVGVLEAARAGLSKTNASGEKRDAALLQLEIVRNRVGIYGYNSGTGNRTYGILNDPGLLPYVTVPAGAGGSSQWMNKTFLEILKDLRAGYAALRTRSGDNINPRTTPITLAIGTATAEFLTITNELGTQTVEDWIKSNYPKTRIESLPEFDGANGGANVAYMYAEKVEGTGDDDGSVWQQLVASKAQPLGVEKRVKTTVEGYTNATAGSMLSRPFANYRMTGI